MCRFLSLLIIGMGLALCTVTEASAAEIRRIPDGGGGGMDIIQIVGPIEQDDDARFREVAASSRDAVVILNSEGGRILPALEIGLEAKERNFATAVPTDGLCASACALIWLAGIPRYAAETASIGFHAAYLVEGGKMKEVGSANALVGAYLNEIGLSQNAIVFVTSAPPEGMEWLTPEKGGVVGIAFDVLAQELDVAQPSVGGSTLADPMEVALAFYRALGAADGELAASLVTPEKRGKGPFNEANIRSFFGAMSKPLKLTELKLVDGSTVEVRYSYVTNAGRSCDGRAVVRTTGKFGRRFIEGIKALDGC